MEIPGGKSLGDIWVSRKSDVRHNGSHLGKAAGEGQHLWGRGLHVTSGTLRDSLRFSGPYGQGAGSFSTFSTGIQGAFVVDRVGSTGKEDVTSLGPFLTLKG